MSNYRKLRLNLEFLESRDVPSTFYVAPGGNNNNDGSTNAPWQTLQYAAGRVAAGDTVIVRAGNYAGFHLTRDGTAALPITFRGEMGATINTRNPTTPDGINLEGADYIIIEGFNVINQPRTGIRSVLNHHVTIRNNIADNNERWGILTGFSDDLLIENNRTSNSHVEHGIYVSNSGDRPTIRGNISFGNFANGIHMNGDVSLGGDGIISNALVEGNTIYNNGQGGGSGINCDGVQNSVIQNNLIYNSSASGISLYRIDGGGGSSGNLVVNNTVMVASNGRWAMNIQSGSTGNTLRNNIFYTAHSFRGSIDISADSLPGFSSDYNVVMNRFTTNGGNTIQTLAQWQANTGQDQHSLVATPAQLFVNLAANDYHLSTTSPALDRGTATQAPNTDLDHLPRPSGVAVDIGAFERQSQTTPGILALTVSTLSVNETAGTATLTVTRSGGSNGAVSVQYATANGTATSGQDYTSTSGTLNWANGDSANKTITIPILDDGSFEGNETFALTLSNPTGGATLGSPISATITIQDNETAQPGVLQLTVSALSINETAGTATLTVTRTNGNNGAVSVQYATANGSATAGQDYTASAGTLNWANGDSASKTITIPILDDASFEGNETFTLTLSNTTGGATLGSPISATITIQDNEQAQPGVLQLNVSAIWVNETAGTATLTVTRANGSNGAVSVQYATTNGTATAGLDYTSTSGTLNWANGDSSSKTITIPILDDTLKEGNENFTVTLSNPSGGASLGTPAVATVTIIDDDKRPGKPKQLIFIAPESGQEPRVKAIDGSTGEELFSFLAYDASFRGGVRVAAGDFNRDGTPDIVTAPGGTTNSAIAGLVRIFDGTTGTPMPGIWGTGVKAYAAPFTKGVNIAVGDLNKDGTIDVVTAPDSGYAPLVHILDGQTGAAQAGRSFYAFSTSNRTGVRVAVGDVNGDGDLDIVTGPASLASEIRVYSGRTTKPSLIRTIRPFTSYVTAGVSVAVADLNGDGRAEIIAGTTSGRAALRIFGTSNTPLRTFLPYPTTYAGGLRLSIGDINDDAQLDLVVSQSRGPNAQVRLYDGATMAEFFAGSGPLVPFPASTGGVRASAWIEG